MFYLLHPASDTVIFLSGLFFISLIIHHPTVHPSNKSVSMRHDWQMADPDFHTAPRKRLLFRDRHGADDVNSLLSLPENRRQADCRLTIHGGCLRRPTWGWSGRCTCHWLNTQTGRSTGWRALWRRGRKTLWRVRCSPACRENESWINHYTIVSAEDTRWYNSLMTKDVVWLILPSTKTRRRRCQSSVMFVYINLLLILFRSSSSLAHVLQLLIDHKTVDSLGC